ncbi:MAG: hypothetical protein ACLUIS_01370 [Longibaculum sp.]
MKKLFLKILLVYSIGWFVILPVYARAGGGNGGDSGSSSGRKAIMNIMIILMVHHLHILIRLFLLELGAFYYLGEL